MLPYSKSNLNLDKHYLFTYTHIHYIPPFCADIMSYPIRKEIPAADQHIEQANGIDASTNALRPQGT